MITIGFSTRQLDENYISQLEKSCGSKSVQIIPIENNGEYSLSEVYNKILEQAEHDIVVLCHDDLKFDTGGWLYKIKSHFEKNPEYGICTDIRVTHLSIGQTNEKWEENRIEFSKKFEDVLPIDITTTDKTLKTFIFVHDQDLIELFEENGKFKGFNNYTYVFLGNRPIDKVENLPNVIISRNYDGHLEDYPKLTSFSGWYTLWKHKLIDTEYVNLFEYDVNYVPDFLPQISKMMYDKQDMIGYIPFPAPHPMFIQHPPFIETLFKSIRRTYHVDIQKLLMNAIHQGNMGHWSSTSNTTFRKNVFDQYMNWMSPMIDEIKVDPNAGHLHERSITIFASMKSKKFILTNGFLKHYQMDSHKTQGHYVDTENAINKLTTNVMD